MRDAEGVLEILRWACSGRETGLPRIEMRSSDALQHPSPELRDALGQLTALTAARLRAGAPPFGDATPVSCDSLVIAGAMGMAANQRGARSLLANLHPAAGFAEWTARHGLVARALPLVGATIADDLRILSPLTAVFERPGPGSESDAFAAAEKLRRHPIGRPLLLAVLAEPTPSAAVRRWRTSLLSRWRAESSEGVDLVLDVYEAAMIHHEAAFLEQIRAARAVIADPNAVLTDESANDALSIARWWEPLSRIERGNVARLRERRYLGYEYRKGLDFFRLTRRTAGEAA